MRAAGRVLAWCGVLLAPWGCASRIPVPASGDAGPGRAVERFLESANRRDLEALARAFGTAEGPVAEAGGGLGCGLRRMASWLAVADPCPGRREIELRMHAIALVLAHDDHEVVSREPVPGRDRSVTRVSVALRRGERTYHDVGFVLVPTSAGWLVEAVELEKVTGGWSGPGGGRLFGSVRRGNGFPLDELDERATGPLRVQESDRNPMGTRSGRGVHGAKAQGHQPVEFRAHVPDPERNVMKSRAGAVQKPGDRTVGVVRLDQLQGSDETDIHAVFGQGLPGRRPLPHQVLEQGRRYLNGPDRDANVVNRAGGRTWNEGTPGLGFGVEFHDQSSCGYSYGLLATGARPGRAPRPS